MSPIYGIDSDQKIDQLRRFNNSSATPGVMSLDSLIKTSMRAEEPEITTPVRSPEEDAKDKTNKEFERRMDEFSRTVLGGSHKSAEEIFGILKNIGAPNVGGKLDPYFTSLEEQMVAIIYLLNQIDDPNSGMMATPEQRQEIIGAYGVILVMQDEMIKVMDALLNPTVENGGKIDFEED